MPYVYDCCWNGACNNSRLDILWVWDTDVLHCIYQLVCMYGKSARIRPRLDVFHAQYIFTWTPRDALAFKTWCEKRMFSNPTKNHADVAELIPGFGIIFLILSGILLVCTVLCITAHCTRKRTVSPPLVPHIQPVSVWGLGLGACDTRN